MSVASVSEETEFQRLVGYVLGNQAAWIASIGIQTAMFRTIADAGENGIREGALAEQLGYTARYVEVWCRAAYAFELLEWDELSGYRMTPRMAKLLLDSSDPQFMGGRIQFYTAFYEDYRAFPGYLRTGGVWPRSAHDPFLVEALSNATKADSAMINEQVLPQAPQILAHLEAGGSILDVGAGTGYHAIHYARRFPQAHVVGLESDARSVELARAAFSIAGLAGRVEIRHGDANYLDDRNAFDLVTMNVTLHETGGPDEHRNVLSRVRRALQKRGTVVISELPYPDSVQEYRENAVYKMYAGLQLHEALVGCGKITQRELWNLLRAVGFANVRVAAHSVATRHVVLGEKPG